MATVLRDWQGRPVRLTEERWQHVCVAHGYMDNMEENVGETLQSPDVIHRSTSDPAGVRLNYRWFRGTVVGDKWVCVVVKYLESDAFVLTAYVTDTIPQGERI